ncbi:MAG: hypothetical protein ACOC78_03115 [Actinomycetota bacterium]
MSDENVVDFLRVIGVDPGGDGKKAKDEKPLPLAYFPGLVEIVDNGGSPAFLLADGEIHHQIELEGRYAIPHPDYGKLFGSPLPARGIVNRDVSPPVLLQEIEAFIAEHLELPGELPPLVGALWNMQTYMQETLDVLPYIYFSGPYGSGKSRALETTAAISWRAIHTAGLTSAAIYRTVETWQPTLLVDEFFASRQGSEDLQTVLNARYRRGLAVIRCRPKSFETDTFKVFGPTCIAGRTINRSLATRSLTATMAKADGPIPRRIHHEWAREIRAQLLAMRLSFYGASLPEAPSLADGRLDELISSLHSVLLLVDPSRDGEFRETVAGQIRRHVADENDSTEAELAEALATITPDSEGKVAVMDIVGALGWDTTDKASATRAGNLIKRAVGLEPCGRVWRDGKKVRGYAWDHEKVQRFVRRYSYTPGLGGQVVPDTLFSQVDSGDHLATHLCFQGGPVDKVVQGGDRPTSMTDPPTGSEVVQENTTSEQEKRGDRPTYPPGPPYLDKGKEEK